MFCPNYKNKEVFDAFNEIVEALGGKPMTEDEFRDSALRKQRTGRDLSAAKVAYRVWNRNQGNPIDEAPNGQKSILFQSLLDHFGDRQKAIVAKTNVYSDEFFNWFGDWTSQTEKKYRYKIYDVPKDRYLSENELSEIRNKFNSGQDIVVYAASNDVQSLLNGIDFRKNQSQYFDIDENAFYASYTLGYAIDYANIYANQKGQDLNKIGLVKIVINNHSGHVSLQGGSEVKIYRGATIKSIEQLDVDKNIRQIETKTRKSNSVSKVVDSNGEPLVVWHGGSLARIFDTTGKHISAGIQKGDIGAYFTTSKTSAKNYENIHDYNYGDVVFEILDQLKKEGLSDEEIEKEWNTSMLGVRSGTRPFFLNIKNPKQTYYSGNREKGYSKTDTNTKNTDGQVITREDTEEIEYVASTPNQIKHVENLGTWNPKTGNIYNAPQITEIAEPFQAMSLSDTFEQDTLQRLLNGDTVSSHELVNQMMAKEGIFIGRFFDLAQVLSRHDVPVRLSSVDLGYGIPASTVAENNGGRVILINKEEIARYTKQGFGEVFLHEMVHAITLQALVSPKTTIEKIFRRKANVVFDSLSKVFEKLPYGIPQYGLSSVEEFVAVFATDYEARDIYYKIAKEIDQKFDNTFLGKFKDFINSLAKLFVNKNIIKSTEEKLSDYETYFANYINNTPTIRNGNIDENSSLRDVYDVKTRTLLENEAINRQLLNLQQRANYLKKHNFELSVQFKGLHFTKDLPNSSNLENIKSSIRSRINALKNANLPESVKQQLLLTAQTQLGMFDNPEVSVYEATSYLLDSLKPAIIQSVEDLRNINRQQIITANNSNYQFHQHQNIGWFNVVLNNMASMLTNETEVQRLISQHNKNKTDEEKINIESITALTNYIKTLSQFVTDANNILDHILDRAALEDFHKTVVEAGSIEGEELITSIQNSGQIFKSDISWIEMTFGQADAATNEMVRAAAHVIKKTDDSVAEKLIEKADSLVKLQKKLKSGEKVTDLYEYVDGKATQYLVRSINFGKFEKDYRNFLAKLNKKYGLDPDDISGPKDEERRISWEIEKNNWLNDHCHRKYTAKYYNAWAKVPMHVKAKLDKINGSISAILDKYNVVDDEGYYHYDKIPDTVEGNEDWKTLQNLWHTKKEMRNPYTNMGEEKQGEEKAVADVLNNLYKELYGDKYKERNKNISKWKQAREEVIRQCGGQEEYDKYLRDEPNNFDAKKLDKWDARNSRYQFKKDANGDAIVFKKIEEEMRGFKFNYGEEYDKLKEKVNDLLRPAYDLAGQVNVDFLSSKTKKEIADLYNKMYLIRKKVISQHPGYQTLNEHYAKILEEYIKYEDTRYMADIKRKVAFAVEEMYGDFDIELFTMMMSEWGRSYDIMGFPAFKPYQYLQVGVARDKDYMEWVPNDAWAEQEEDDRYVNKEFDKSFGESRVPFKDLYDNSKAWKKIQNSPTLHKLYDEVVNTLNEANLMQTNRNWTNRYRLPGVSMQLHERFKRNYILSWPKVLIDWVKEKIGLVDKSEEDIILKDRTTSNDENTSEGDEIKSTQTNIIGAQPDGTRYMALPQYYTRRMKNPENISYELLDIVISYYKMSLNYSERLKVRDTLETLADFIKKHSAPTSEETNSVNKVIRKITSSEDVSNLYKQMRNLLDMGLYNKVRTEYKLGHFKLSTTFSTIQQYTTAVNLGWNKKVAAVGFLTAMHNHLLNAIVGKEYGFKSLLAAMGDVAEHVVMQFAKRKFYSQTPTDKLQVIMKRFNIADQLDRNYTNTSSNKVTRIFLQNHTFGYLASVDYLTKSQITVACLKDYRYINGKFYSSYDIKMLQHDKKKYKELLTAYNKAKSLYNLIDTKDGKISFKDEKVSNAWQNDKDRIISKCQKQSEKADGVCTGLQRAAVQRSWIGMFLMIHRQYLPLMLHERWGQRIYDYDTQEYTHGQFRMFYQYLKELSANTLLPGVAAGAGVGYFFGGGLGAALGIAVASILRARGAAQGKNKSFSQINKEFFNSFNNQKNTIRSVENQFAIKQIFVENLLFAMMRYLVVNPICALADDDDDNWFLQSIAYWLKATLFEISVAYNISDLTSNIKSPTASTVLLDRLTYLGDQSISDLFAWILYGLSLSDKEPKLIGKNSPYSGWSRAAKGAFQLSTPLHNEWEQDTPKGIKFKRKYLENQIISESDADKFNIFDIFE